MITIAILIPTFLRPNGVLRTLDGIAKLSMSDFPGGFSDVSLHVVVADNDAENQAGLRAVESLEPTFPFGLHKLVVAERGIPHSRNALLKYATGVLGAQYSIFIDDDETPDRFWLRELLSVQAKTGADVVGGSVSATYEAEPPAWARKLGLYETPVAADGICDLVDSTANVLVRNDILPRVIEPWFHPGFALTGGSDKEFFLRLKKHGAVFAWSQRANVNELVPASRATEEWVLQRAYRVGNLDMRLVLLSGSKFALAKEVVVSVVALGAALGAYVIFWPFTAKRIMALRRLRRQAGKLAAFRGSMYEEYATIHGH
ncbi:MULTISPECIES: glycosyltransferase family 2 protein [unclassified Rhizobium]|uniref:glycosyltransferase n=1 Tax=unclassified Rhizobium TaxID=2613769 RepID=UPI000EA8873F|nr:MULTISPECIES: glycosyltransferase family 2 protein [unclassified Rhizobium]AYG70164.1 glycosyltransferase family 2 protein [Rhizobium sp. CCGE531]AYG76539.1 glycosyltransferase family 2 protein [Rhizobium sp. CCGE532]